MSTFTDHFIHEYRANSVQGLITPFDIFSGYENTAADLAMGYGNIRTFRLLYSMHKLGMSIDPCISHVFSNDWDVGALIHENENLCISNCDNHLKDRYHAEVRSRAKNDFEYYKGLL